MSETAYMEENEERDPSPACRHCEFASRITDDTYFVFCHHALHEVHIDGLCNNYIYDLLKRGENIAARRQDLTLFFTPEPIDF